MTDRSTCFRPYTIFILLSLAFYLPHLNPAQAVVVINEIFPKPVPDESAEWIELYNTGPDAISLGNWRLEDTSGNKSSYTLSASAQIPVGNILTLYQSQTSLILDNQGDTVNLYNPENNLVDSQSYSSTLGFNNSVGRSTDGSGTWTICREYTENHLNENYCPLPTSAPTSPAEASSLADLSPVASAKEEAKAGPITVSSIDPTLSLIQIVAITPTPPLSVTKTPVSSTPDSRQLVGIVTLIIGITLGLIALIGRLINLRQHPAN